MMRYPLTGISESPDLGLYSNAVPMVEVEFSFIVKIFPRTHNSDRNVILLKHTISIASVPRRQSQAVNILLCNYYFLLQTFYFI